MHHFDYRDAVLYCEDVPVPEIAEAVGTPFYLYSHATLTRHFTVFDRAFDGLKRLICFSAKANSSHAILRLFARMGSGLDIVSGGELYRGLQAGISPKKIVYSGVGKRVDEIDYALNAGILLFNVESLEELRVINQRAGILGKKAPIAIRVNPDVDAKTHPYISTGLKKNKFGIDKETAIQGYKLAAQLDHLKILGIDCHIGSQITQVQPFVEALKSLKALMTELETLGIRIKYLDMGGGLGITYDDESSPHPLDYAEVIKSALDSLKVDLIFEPGRVIVGNAGILVTRILYQKAGGEKNFIITDAAMNDLIRPTLYNAYHNIKPVISNGGEPVVADIVGPICESGDFLARDRILTGVVQGDLVAVMSAGAYAFTMSSNYCSRLRVAEVMVRGDRFEIIRARETYQDLVKGETVPSFLE